MTTPSVPHLEVIEGGADDTALIGLPETDGSAALSDESDVVDIEEVRSVLDHDIRRHDGVPDAPLGEVHEVDFATGTRIDSSNSASSTPRGEGAVVTVVPAADTVVHIDAAQDFLDLRDELIGAPEALLLRRLKRALSDVENELLDRLRRSRRNTTVEEVVGDEEELQRSLVASVGEPLRTCVAAGADYLDRLGVVTVESDGDAIVVELEKVMAQALVAPLTARITTRVASATAPFAEHPDLIELIRADFREYRNERLGGFAGDLTTLAFNQGAYESAPDSQSFCWLVDNGGLPCPDAEDNSLAGAVPCGEEFPTGDLIPPAHPGCRCLLSPADK